MQLIVPTIVWLWHDGTLKSKFSLVYTGGFHWSMSGWGNGEPGKLHPYNSNAEKSVFYHKVRPFSSIWNMLHTQKKNCGHDAVSTYNLN